MDFIIMLVIFGVISSLTKSSKKSSQQRKRTPYSNPNRSLSTSQNPLKTMMSEVKKPENLQDGLTSLFNMLAGEEVLKDAKTVERERMMKLHNAEEMRRREIRDAESIEKSVQDNLTWTIESMDSSEITDLPEIDDEMIELQNLTDDYSFNVSPEFSLTEAQKGFIWHEILERPKVL
jgi:hypothetical protein